MCFYIVFTHSTISICSFCLLRYLPVLGVVLASKMVQNRIRNRIKNDIDLWSLSTSIFDRFWLAFGSPKGVQRTGFFKSWNDFGPIWDRFGTQSGFKSILILLGTIWDRFWTILGAKIFQKSAFKITDIAMSQEVSEFIHGNPGSEIMFKSCHYHGKIMLNSC